MNAVGDDRPLDYWDVMWEAAVEDGQADLLRPFVEADRATSALAARPRLLGWCEVFGDDAFPLTRDPGRLRHLIATGDLQQRIAAAEIYFLYKHSPRALDELSGLLDKYPEPNFVYWMLDVLTDLYKRTKNQQAVDVLKRYFTPAYEPLREVVQSHIDRILDDSDLDPGIPPGGCSPRGG